MAVDWNYFNRFNAVTEKYLPDMGQGETVATQIVTAVSKLVYKWYNDGDVFDNTKALTGWANDLSSYANWLYRYIEQGRGILLGVWDCFYEGEYEDLLKKIADMMLDGEFLEYYDEIPATGDIYKCDGPFRFEEYAEDDDEEDYY